MTQTEPATHAEREMRLIVEYHRAGLGTPRLTLQRLRGWADEIKNYQADQANARALYAEAIQQLDEECQTLRGKLAIAEAALSTR